jgi:hypothetical protein
MGKLLTRLPQLTLALNCCPNSHLHNCKRFAQLQNVRAAETLKSSHRPDGKNAYVLAPTHACTTTNASVNYRMYVPQRT